MSTPLDRARCILIFGGSFDPPHVAHLILPRLVMEQVGADTLLYVPCATQPLKQDRRQTSTDHRLAMLRLALGATRDTRIWTDEIDRAGDGVPSYTVDTLERLRAQLPNGVKLKLLIGADQVALFPKWHRGARVTELAEPVVMARPPATIESVLDALPADMDRAAWRTRVIRTPMFDISSTLLRRRLATGMPVDGWTPAPVVDYIRRHKLYAEAEG